MSIHWHMGAVTCVVETAVGLVTVSVTFMGGSVVEDTLLCKHLFSADMGLEIHFDEKNNPE